MSDYNSNTTSTGSQFTSNLKLLVKPFSVSQESDSEVICITHQKENVLPFSKEQKSPVFKNLISQNLF